MNEKAFVKNIVMAYQNARNTVSPNKKLLRGRSHTVSSVAEDLFAEYLVSSDSAISQIYIDQAMSVAGSNKKFYPDIVVVKGNEIVLLIDLKMDLGYMRKDILSTCKKHHDLSREIRGKECKDIKTGDDKHTVTGLKFSKNIQYDIAVITSKNISKSAIDEQLHKLKEAKISTRVHILTTGIHPNEYGLKVQEILDNITINERSFKDIIETLSEKT